MILKKKEYTGGSVSYYRVQVPKPTAKDLPPYEAECNDIIKALKMTFAEGNAFKAIWRSCAARHLGVGKEGYKDGLYDAEKVVFFGNDMIEDAVASQTHSPKEETLVEALTACGYSPVLGTGAIAKKPLLVDHKDPALWTEIEKLVDRRFEERRTGSSDPFKVLERKETSVTPAINQLLAARDSATLAKDSSDKDAS